MKMRSLNLDKTCVSCAGGAHTLQSFPAGVIKKLPKASQPWPPFGNRSLPGVLNLKHDNEVMRGQPKLSPVHNALLGMSQSARTEPWNTSGIMDHSLPLRHCILTSLLRRRQERGTNICMS